MTSILERSSLANTARGEAVAARVGSTADQEPMIGIRIGRESVKIFRRMGTETQRVVGVAGVAEGEVEEGEAGEEVVETGTVTDRGGMSRRKTKVKRVTRQQSIRCRQTGML